MKKDYWTMVTDGTFAKFQLKALMALDEYLLAIEGEKFDPFYLRNGEKYHEMMMTIMRDIHLGAKDIMSLRDEYVEPTREELRKLMELDDA